MKEFKVLKLKQSLIEVTVLCQQIANTYYQMGDPMRETLLYARERVLEEIGKRDTQERFIVQGWDMTDKAYAAECAACGASLGADEINSHWRHCPKHPANAFLSLLKDQLQLALADINRFAPDCDGAVRLRREIEKL